MSQSSLATATIFEQVHQQESRLPLKHPACRSRFLLHPYRTTQVVLFFHGFTAGSYQFEPLGQALFERGHNVLIPRQPGHGIAGDWNRHTPPPLPTDIRIYQDFVSEWLQIAQTLGEQVIVGGLSSGANLAAWLALEYPYQIEKVLLFAPYLSGTNRVVNTLVKTLPIYFEWFNKDGPGNFGYKGFPMPALRVFLHLAEEVLERAKTEKTAPMLVVSSEADHATNPQDHWHFFKAGLKRQPKSWYYRFHQSLNIGHRMMTAVEGNQYQDWVIALAKAYIGSDLSWNQLQDIANLMSNGQSWGDSIQTIGLENQVSSELERVMEWSMIKDQLNCLMPPR